MRFCSFVIDCVRNKQYNTGITCSEGGRVEAQQAILTLDLGTTFFKACLFDGTGALRSCVRVEPPLMRPSPERWELDPGAFLETLQTAVEQVFAPCPELRSAVEAVTFATQANSFTVLDNRKWPLLPFILWPDTRAAGTAGLEGVLRSLESNRLSTGVPGLSPEFMAAKLHALRAADPMLLSRGCKVRLLSDFFIEWLTGHAATEAGVAGLTALCDSRALRWIPAACALVGLAEGALPPILRAGTDLGPIRPTVAETLGLPPRCRAVMGALDQYAGAIGVGNVAPGGLSETTGTVLAVVHCAPGYADCPVPFFQGPAWAADRVYRMSFGSVSANLLEWYRNGLPDRPSYAALDALAAAAPVGATGLALREDALVRPVADGFVGWDARHGRGDAVQCILETVARALADHVRTLCGAALPAEIRCAGGGARSDVWLQIKADVTGIPMTALTCPEPTSLGAAMLAGRALGWGELDELATAWVRPRQTFYPQTGGV